MIQILEGSVLIDNLDEFLHKLKKIGDERNLSIQALDADKCAGEGHIRFAVEKAISSFNSGTNIAKDLAKEIMLYAAGTHQIKRAVKLGIHKGRNNIVLVSVGEAKLPAFKEIIPENVLAYNKSKKDAIMETFGITAEEVEAVGEEKIPELVQERVALVDVIK